MYAANIELIINGKLIEADSNTLNPTLTKVLFSSEDPLKRQGVFSYSITIPVTAKNEVTFGHIASSLENIRKFRKTSYKAQLYVNDSLILDGTFEIDDVTLKGYTGNLLGSDTDWSLKLDKKKLSDLDWAGQDYTATVASDWDLNHYKAFNRQQSDLMFPFVSYGTYNFESNNDDLLTVSAPYSGFTFNGFPPSTYYLNVIEKIFEEAGLKLSCPVLSDERYQDLVIPYVGKGQYNWNYRRFTEVNAKTTVQNLYNVYNDTLFTTQQPYMARNHPDPFFSGGNAENPKLLFYYPPFEQDNSKTQGIDTHFQYQAGTASYNIQQGLYQGNWGIKYAGKYRFDLHLEFPAIKTRFQSEGIGKNWDTWRGNSAGKLWGESTTILICLVKVDQNSDFGAYYDDNSYVQGCVDLAEAIRKNITATDYVMDDNILGYFAAKSIGGVDPSILPNGPTLFSTGGDVTVDHSDFAFDFFTTGGGYSGGQIYHKQMKLDNYLDMSLEVELDVAYGGGVRPVIITYENVQYNAAGGHYFYTQVVTENSTFSGHFISPTTIKPELGDRTQIDFVRDFFKMFNLFPRYNEAANLLELSTVSRYYDNFPSTKLEPIEPGGWKRKAPPQLNSYSYKWKADKEDYFLKDLELFDINNPGSSAVEIGFSPCGHQQMKFKATNTWVDVNWICDEESKLIDRLRYVSQADGSIELEIDLTRRWDYSQRLVRLVRAAPYPTIKMDNLVGGATPVNQQLLKTEFPEELSMTYVFDTYYDNRLSGQNGHILTTNVWMTAQQFRTLSQRIRVADFMEDHYYCIAVRNYNPLSGTAEVELLKSV